MIGMAAKESELVVSVLAPADIIEAEERAYELSGSLGFERPEVVRVVSAVARMAALLIRSAGVGRMVLAAMDRRGRRGLEVAAESDAPSWTPERVELTRDTVELLDEFSWDSAQDGRSRLVARTWRRDQPARPAVSRKKNTGLTPRAAPPCASAIPARAR